MLHIYYTAQDAFSFFPLRMSSLHIGVARTCWAVEVDDVSRWSVVQSSRAIGYHGRDSQQTIEIQDTICVLKAVVLVPKRLRSARLLPRRI